MDEDALNLKKANYFDEPIDKNSVCRFVYAHYHLKNNGSEAKQSAQSLYEKKNMKLSKAKLELMKNPKNEVNRNWYLISLANSHKLHELCQQIQKGREFNKTKLNLYQSHNIENSFISLLASIINFSTSYKKKLSELKVRLFSNPTCKFSRKLFEVLNKQKDCSQKFDIKQKLDYKYKNSVKILNEYLQAKNVLIKRYFSNWPDVNFLTSGQYLWANLDSSANSAGSSSEVLYSQQKTWVPKICALDAII